MNRVRSVVILSLLLTNIGALYYILICGAPSPVPELLTTLLGWFLAKGSDAIAYLIASTDHSLAKTNAMVSLAERAPPPPPPVTSTFDIPPSKDPQP